MRTLALTLALSTVAPAPSLAQSLDDLPTLSHTRQLRRVLMTLEGRPPSEAEYQAILGAADDAARDAMIAAQIEASLDSQAFYEQVLDWGKEVLRVGRYDHDAGAAWSAAQSIVLRPCPEGSMHEGRFGILYNDSGWGCPTMPDCGAAKQGDSWALCDDPDAPLDSIEPWWAPGTTVDMIGTATSQLTEVPDADNPGQMRDCGVASFGYQTTWKNDNSDASAEPRCGCGPNLIYCSRRAQQAGGGDYLWSNGEIFGYDGFAGDDTGQRRHVFEEPARLWAHLITNDRPLSDLVLGDYTVATMALQHMYVRVARQQTKNAGLDQVDWWSGISDPLEWREVVVEDMHPSLLADRSYHFDPSVDSGEPDGVPAAGVLTMIGSLGSFERERPRAARWLEIFTCREFSPPPPEADLGDFEVDPATEGVCQHCHKVLDPAAIHFKRFDMTGRRMVGMSPYLWDDFYAQNSQRRRWDASFVPDTWMTPVSQAAIEADPNARFIDFLPPGYELLGEASDGTIGPLGFAKMLVASGQFDRCMVRRTYERFGGAALDSGAHAAYIDKLTAAFVDNDRDVRELIRTILAEPIFMKGR